MCEQGIRLFGKITTLWNIFYTYLCITVCYGTWNQPLTGFEPPLIVRLFVSYLSQASHT